MHLLLKRRIVVLLLLSSCLFAGCGPGAQTANRPDSSSLDVVLMLTMLGLVALDRQDGKQRWTFRPPGWQSPQESGTGPLIIVDGVVYWKADHLYAIRAEDGKQLWSTALDARGPSILISVASDLVYTTIFSTVYAFDKQNGRLVWKKETNISDAAGSVQLLLTVSGTTLYVWGQQALLALDAETGATRWEYRHGNACGQITIVMPHNDIILVQVGGIGTQAANDILGLQASDGQQHWQMAVPNTALLRSGQDRFYTIAAENSTGKTSPVPTTIGAYSFNNGQRQWTIQDQVASSEFADETFYQVRGTALGEIVARSGADGHLLWSVQSDHAYTSLTIDNGTIYALTQKGEVVALSARDGTQRWIYASGDAQVALSVQAHLPYLRGFVVGQEKGGKLAGTLMALDPDGKGPLWQAAIGDEAFGPFGTSSLEAVITVFETGPCP